MKSLIYILLIFFLTFSSSDDDDDIFPFERVTPYQPWDPRPSKPPTEFVPPPFRPTRPPPTTAEPSFETTEITTISPQNATEKWSFKLRCNKTYKEKMASKDSTEYKDFVNVAYPGFMKACEEVLGEGFGSVSRDWHLSAGSVAVDSYINILSTIDPSTATTWDNALVNNLPGYINGSFEIKKYKEPTPIPILPLAIGLGVGGGLLLVALVCGVMMFCIRRKRIIETEKLKRNTRESQLRSIPPSINGHHWTKSQGVSSLTSPKTGTINEGFDDNDESIKHRKIERKISENHESIRDKTNIYGLKSNLHNGSFIRPILAPKVSNDAYMLPQINLKGQEYHYGYNKHLRNNTTNNRILNDISNAIKPKENYTPNNIMVDNKIPSEKSIETSHYAHYTNKKDIEATHYAVYNNKNDSKDHSNEQNFVDSGRSSDSVLNHSELNSQTNRNSQTDNHTNSQTSNHTNTRTSNHSQTNSKNSHESEKFNSAQSHFNLALPRKNDKHHQLMQNISSSSSDLTETSRPASVKSKNSTDDNANDTFKPAFNVSKLVSSVRSNMSRLWKNNKDSILYRKH